MTIKEIVLNLLNSKTPNVFVKNLEVLIKEISSSKCKGRNCSTIHINIKGIMNNIINDSIDTDNYRIIPKDYALFFLMGIGIDRIMNVYYEKKEHLEINGFTSKEYKNMLKENILEESLNTVLSFLLDFYKTLKDEGVNAFQDIESIYNEINKTNYNKMISHLDFNKKISFNKDNFADKLTILHMPYISDLDFPTCFPYFNSICLTNSNTILDNEYGLYNILGEHFLYVLSNGTNDIPNEWNPSFLGNKTKEERICIFADLFTYKLLENTSIDYVHKDLMDNKVFIDDAKYFDRFLK